MTTITLQGNESRTTRAVRWTMLGLVWLVAAFWAWFVVASHWDEGPALAIEGLTVVVPIAFAAWLVWKKPLWGGVLLIALGAASAWRFANVPVWVAMSGPLVLAGAYFTWVGLRRA